MLESCSRRQDNLALTHRGAQVIYTHKREGIIRQVKYIRARTANHRGTGSEHRDQTIKIKHETDKTQSLTFTSH